MNFNRNFIYIQFRTNEKEENQTPEKYDFYGNSSGESYNTPYNLPVGLKFSPDSPEINGEAFLLSSKSGNKGMQQFKNDWVSFSLFNLDYYTKVNFEN
jgi:hypothetical protein